MTAVAEALRAASARTGKGCHLCGMLPTGAVSPELVGDDRTSVLLEPEPGKAKLMRCRDRRSCERRMAALR